MINICEKLVLIRFFRYFNVNVYWYSATAFVSKLTHDITKWPMPTFYWKQPCYFWQWHSCYCQLQSCPRDGLSIECTVHIGGTANVEDIGYCVRGCNKLWDWRRSRLSRGYWRGRAGGGEYLYREELFDFFDIGIFVSYEGKGETSDGCVDWIYYY